MDSKHICFCVAGWHFSEAVYAQIKESGNDLFIISHQPAKMIPDYIDQYVPISHVFIEPNIGYDWGCYQQFLEKGFWKSYKVICFLHDDLAIRSLDFIPHTLELIKSSAQVVGNGWNSHQTRWPKTHPACYAHSSWIPPSQSFEHNTIRGSFFSISTQAIETIRKIEVFWDPRHLYIRFGNHSLIATCGKLQYLFGERCFAFLGEDYRNSLYISELERGGAVRRQPSLSQRFYVNFYKQMGRSYVLSRMHHDKNIFLINKWMGMILTIFDGVDRTAQTGSRFVPHSADFLN